MPAPRLPLYMQGVPGGLAESVDDMGASLAALEAAEAAKASGGNTTQVANAAGSAFISPQGQPPPQPAPTGVPKNVGVPGSTEGNMDLTEGHGAFGAGMDIMAPLIPAQRGPGPTVLGEGENPYPFGGKEGRSTFEEAFRDRPGQVESYMEQMAQGEEEYGQNRANTIDALQRHQAQEMGVLRQRQMERIQEAKDKQAQLDAATQRYSDDLADTGKFWRNPGNIISAIGAAVVQLGSNDIGIGLKIINQAVQQDWMHRKQLADMHLGELRSNLAAYRQIAGDEELGDRLALNESYRIAAMDLQRLESQFQGKQAKLKLRAMSSELMKRWLQEKGMIYNQYLYNKPRIENPLIKKNLEAGGGFQAFAAPGAPGGRPAPMQLTEPKVGSGGVAAMKPNAGNGIPQGTASGPTGWRNSAKGISEMESRSPGSSDQASMARTTMVRETLARIGLNPDSVDPRLSNEELSKALGPFAQKFNAESLKVRADVKKEMADLAPRVQPLIQRVEDYRSFGQAINELNVIAREMGVSPDELIDSKGKMITPGNLYKRYSEWVASSDPSGKHDAQQSELDRYKNRFNQTLNRAVNAYTRAMYAGNVSPGEKQMRDNYISQDQSWSSIVGFYNDISGAAESEIRTALQGASPTTQVLWNIQMGQKLKKLPLSGTPGYVAKDTSVKAPETNRESKNAEKVKGTMDDPEVQRALKFLRGGK